MRAFLVSLNFLLLLVSVYYFVWGGSVAAVFPLLNFLVTVMDLGWWKKYGLHLFTVVFNSAFALLALMALGAVLSVQIGLEEVTFNPRLAYLGPPALLLLPVVNIWFIRRRQMTQSD